MALSFQKQKDDCLIISSKDNHELYKIGNIASQKNHFYISLKYPNPKKNKEYNNPLVDVLAPKNPTGVSYNLQNRKKIKDLPDTVNRCKCMSLKNINLGMKFKLYVEQKDGWVVFDAEKLLVEE